MNQTLTEDLAPGSASRETALLEAVGASKSLGSAGESRLPLQTVDRVNSPIRRRKRYPNKWILLLAAALATAGWLAKDRVVDWLPISRSKSAADMEQPKIEKVVSLGRLEPEGEVIDVAGPSGSGDARVQSLAVDVGDRVEAGQVLAVLDNNEQLQTEQAVAKAQVEQARVRLLQSRLIASTTYAQLQPHIAASLKREAGIKGDVDHFAALSFLRGLLLILKDSGYAGLVLVLDEIETIQRVRSDVREKGLNALRQLIDDIDGGRFPGLYLVITGTPAFYDGPQGIQRLEPLAQRLHVDFQTDARFDNPRAVQLRLTTFDHQRLVEVGTKVRELFAADCLAPSRVRSLADGEYIESLARSLTGKLGGKTGIAPRLFLKKLVADVLDRVDQFDDFDPRKDYQLTVTSHEMTSVEREAQSQNVNDIELDL